MANADYVQTGAGTFASILALDAPLGRFDTIINYTRFRFSSVDAIEVGMAVMVGEEIMSVVAVGVLSITVGRGCADTIPAEHPKDAIAWIFDSSNVGSDQVERSASDTVAVKVSPFTIGGGGVPTETVVPLEVTMNWRFFRPYPPGRMQINGEPWTTPAVVDANTAALHLTWAHRDRVLQADKLVPHEAAPVGPEPGTTYTLRVLHPVTGALVRTEVGLVGSEAYYRRAQAIHDLGQTDSGRITFTSSRDGLDAWQAYEATFTLVPGEVGDIPLMAFAQRVIEAPYAINVGRQVGNYAGNFVVAMAARPADRMADAYQLVAGGTVQQNENRFTPWATSDFRLPELETTINIRTSSLYSGVPLTGAKVGDLALIDDELVQIETVGPAQIRVRRGCCDTVPAVHIAGARIWLLGSVFAFDAIERTDGEQVDYRLRPVSYGAPYAVADLPANPVTFQRRAELPYPPGRMVVNGRPWFEEAQAIVGTATMFSWARRDRVAQGSSIVAHEDVDQGAETGQVTRLRFFYETPAEAEGGAPVEHVLRQHDITSPAGSTNPNVGTSFTYTYVMAAADGLAAGQALGICGTVVIYCRISSVRAGLESLQSYRTPIRVPSFPC